MGKMSGGFPFRIRADLEVGETVELHSSSLFPTQLLNKYGNDVKDISVHAK